MRPYPPSERCLLAGLLLLLAGLGTGGCLLDELCTPADSTYSCCLKQHPASEVYREAFGEAWRVTPWEII